MGKYLVDTNFFFECDDASNLPWHELSGDKPGKGPDISLFVPSTVISEIERHKAKGNSRTARRARTISAALRRARDAAGVHATEVRTAGPKVTVHLPPVVSVDFAQFPNLNPNKPDHYIAAEYAEIRKHQPDLKVLTDDTLLFLALRSLGFEPVAIPENWKLQPEKDERDDKIDRLQDELKSLKQSLPEMAVLMLDRSGNEVKVLEQAVELVEPNEAEIEGVHRSIVSNHPMASDFGSQAKPPSAVRHTGLGLEGLLRREWRPPSEEKIEAYKAKDYPRWVDEVRSKLPLLVEAMNVAALEVPFIVSISNTGFVNARDVRLKIAGFDGILLLDDGSQDDPEELEEAFSLPAPPAAPRGRYSSYGLLTAPAISFPEPFGLRDFSRPPNNPNSFYFSGGRPDDPVEALELTCEAFPHQGEPYALGFRAIIDHKNLGKQARVRIRLEASNLRQPVEKYVRIMPTFTNGDFAKRVEEMKGTLFRARSAKRRR